jgi:hypothetical protein|tara:strand:- start:736 stop:1098 length:363 start_codon:yes stop_codon:yes gene_type:complete
MSDIQGQLRRQFSSGQDYRKHMDQLHKFRDRIRKNRKEQSERKAWGNADASIHPEYVPPKTPTDSSDKKYKNPASYTKTQRKKDWWEHDFPIGDQGDSWLGQRQPPQTQRDMQKRISRRV